MVECHWIPLFDGVPQVTDSLRRQNVNWKGIQIVEPENTAIERDFGGHARGCGRECFAAIANHVTRMLEISIVS